MKTFLSPLEREALASVRLDGETQALVDTNTDARRQKTRQHLVETCGEGADWLDYCIMYVQSFEDSKAREKSIRLELAAWAEQATVAAALVSQLRGERAEWARLLAWAGAGAGRHIELRDPFHDGFIIQITLADGTRHVMHGSNVLGIVVSKVLGMWEGMDGAQDQAGA